MVPANRLRRNQQRAFRALNILDEHSRECPLSADLALPNRLPGNATIRVKRKLNSTEVIVALTDLYILRGVPAYIRSDNGPEFIAEAVRGWITAAGAIALLASVTRKAFTNDAVLARLDTELSAERDRVDRRRAEDREADADRLARIETDIRAMRDLMFDALQRGRTD